MWVQHKHTHTHIHPPHTHQNVSSQEGSRWTPCPHTYVFNTFPEPVCAPAGVYWVGRRPAASSGISVCQAGSQDSAGVSWAQKWSQGPINSSGKTRESNRYRDHAISLHSVQDLLYRFKVWPLLAHRGAFTHRHAPLLLSHMKVACCGLQASSPEIITSVSMLAQSLQRLFRRVCLGAIAVRLFKSTQREEKNNN